MRERLIFLVPLVVFVIGALHSIAIEEYERALLYAILIVLLGTLGSKPQRRTCDCKGQWEQQHRINEAHTEFNGNQLRHNEAVRKQTSALANAVESIAAMLGGRR